MQTSDPVAATELQRSFSRICASISAGEQAPTPVTRSLLRGTRNTVVYAVLIAHTDWSELCTQHPQSAPSEDTIAYPSNIRASRDSLDFLSHATNHGTHTHLSTWVSRHTRVNMWHVVATPPEWLKEVTA